MLWMGDVIHHQNAANAQMWNHRFQVQAGSRFGVVAIDCD